MTIREEEYSVWRKSIFQPDCHGIRLEEMDRVKLLNRTDSKFIFHIQHLHELLEKAKAYYSILEIGEKRIFRYKTLYFDTPSFLFYHQHQAGKPERTKVRFREYLDSGEAFFEVKKKIRGSRTDKFRVSVPNTTHQLNGREHALMEELRVPAEGLEEKMQIYYERITLVSMASAERITIDLNLGFRKEDNEMQFPSLVIAEVKQEKMSVTSPFIRLLRELQIRRTKISKYAIAVALMNPRIKKNKFKSQIIKLHKITGTSWKTFLK